MCLFASHQLSSSFGCVLSIIFFGSAGSGDYDKNLGCIYEEKNDCSSYKVALDPEPKKMVSRYCKRICAAARRGHTHIQKTYNIKPSDLPN